MSKASRCWSAPFRSKNQSGSPALLSRNGVKHNVLNAKFHEKEAEIMAQAGRKGAVTIATNMAGRGTDILLGGNPDFLFKQVLYREEGLPEERKLEVYEQIKAECEKTNKRSSPPADCISLAPNGMKAAASTISCGAAPAGKAIPAHRASICRLKTTSCASSPPNASRN